MFRGSVWVKQFSQFKQNRENQTNGLAIKVSSGLIDHVIYQIWEVTK